jgi:hypothetical protein
MGVGLDDIFEDKLAQNDHKMTVQLLAHGVLKKKKNHRFVT